MERKRARHGDAFETRRRRCIRRACAAIEPKEQGRPRPAEACRDVGVPTPSGAPPVEAWSKVKASPPKRRCLGALQDAARSEHPTREILATRNAFIEIEKCVRHHRERRDLRGIPIASER